MSYSMSLTEIDEFARDCIHANTHPNDEHIFILYQCHTCRGNSFRVTIEHHTGSKDWNFKGIIWGECTKCGYLGRLFTFTGEHRKMIKEERPLCECGNRIFIAGQCERFEGEKGIPGFFDEGVIVGKCCSCNLNRIFAFTD